MIACSLIRLFHTSPGGRALTWTQATNLALKKEIRSGEYPGLTNVEIFRITKEGYYVRPILTYLHR
jgi:hypothetical protein